MRLEPETDQIGPDIADPLRDILQYPSFLLSAIVESCEDAIISKNLSGIVSSWNAAAVRIFGYSAAEMIGQSILRIIPPELQGEEVEILNKIKAGERIDHYETVRVDKHGAKLDVSLTISPVRNYLGGIIGSSKIVRDISSERRCEEARFRLAAIVESSEQAIIGKDTNGIITSWNSAASATFGYTAEEVIGQPILRLIPKELHAEEAGILEKIRSGIRIDHLRTKRIKKNGDEIHISLSVSPIKNSAGQIIGSSKIARDISIEVLHEEQLAHLSQHDQLTGLPNRQLLNDRLQMMLARAERDDAQCAVMVLNLNLFKAVNDQYGHHIGDELLVQTADRLTSSLRAVDTVSRMGGDEFIILVSELVGPKDALVVARKLRSQFNKPFVLSNDITAKINASIGICMNSKSECDGESLLRMADTAMHRAKSGGGDQIELFTEEIARHESRRRAIVVALREAVRAKEFTLEYQPIVDLRSGDTRGLECLLRLHSRRMGNISPSEFIPIAEATGLIEPIGEWVIHHGCQTIGSLNRELGTAFFISINLSPRQLQQHDLLATIEHALVNNNVKPDWLVAEITEGVLMQDCLQITHVLEGLRRLGVRIAIDDFGTGFSNISYLWHFAVDRLKLDRSMISSLSQCTESSVVTKAIIALAHQLKMSVVAEGVETLDQADILKNADCDFAQGYLFSKPAPLSVIKALLMQHL
jgi:diguanylate cyclase (GGDEF)-like protein/PAS domain S-box-containing protein